VENQVGDRFSWSFLNIKLIQHMMEFVMQSITKKIAPTCMIQHHTTATNQFINLHEKPNTVVHGRLGAMCQSLRDHADGVPKPPI
jgi:hypothetical protein